MNASAEEAHEFLSSRGFSLRVRDEAGVFWADLTSHRSGRVVADRYGRGVDQTSAVVAAFNRYRLEQADWDTRGIELILQFTPARTASHSLRLHVKDAFEGVGLRIDSWTVTYGDDKELPGQLKWAEPSLDVTLKTIGDVSVLGRIAYPLGEALAAIRRTEPHIRLSHHREESGAAPRARVSCFGPGRGSSRGNEGRFAHGFHRQHVMGLGQ